MRSTEEKEILTPTDVEVQPRLQRNALNLFQILSSNLAVLAPAEGIFLSIGLAVAFLGSRAPWAFAIAAVAILTIGNTLSEFSRVRPSTGSFISLLGTSLQSYSPRLAVFVSTTCIMLLQLAYPVGLAATVVFLGSWVNSFVPALNWMLVSVAAVVLITPLVLRGVVVPTIWCFIFFSIEAAGLVVLSIVVLFMTGGHSNVPFTNLGGMPGFSGLLLAFPIIISGYIGWETAVPLAEESKNPRRHIPITIYASILIMGVIYLLSSFAAVVGFAALGGKDPMGNLAGDAAPFLTLAQHYIPWFAVVVAIMGVTSCLGLYLAAINSNARITFSSAREGILPSVLARLTRGPKPVPYVSLFLYAGLVLALIIIPGIWLKAIDVFAYEATLGAVPVVLVYLLSNLALPLYFWKKRRDEFNWFRHVAIPVIGIGVLALPIYGFFAPNQPAPYNYFGWIFAGFVVVSVAWAAYVMIARPRAAKTLGSIIADE